MRVTLRQRQKAKKISLYLDYYHKGRRRYEYLNLYLEPEKPPKKLSKEVRNQNKETLMLAEAIRSKRQVEIQSGHFGFADLTKTKAGFIKYVERLATDRLSSPGNHAAWSSALKHLRDYTGGEISFADTDKDWLEGFKTYLQKSACTNSGIALAQNTQSSYFNRVKAAFNQAIRDGIIRTNPAAQVSCIPSEETQRVFLTREELGRLARTDCDISSIKTAFLFSALTGLRWSDVKKLTWDEIQYSQEMGYYIRFRQKKTGGAETLPVSDQAVSLLGDRGKAGEVVIKDLYYHAWHNVKLQEWVHRAGIQKKVTFHCARHTYATLQLTLGTDIYTVSKLLGHKDLKTTQIYAKIVDEKKKEAANKINFEI